MNVPYYLTTVNSDLSVPGDNWDKEPRADAPTDSTLTSLIIAGDGNPATAEEIDYAFLPPGNLGDSGAPGDYSAVVEIDTGFTQITLDMRLARVNAAGAVQSGPIGSDGGGQVASAGAKTFDFTAPALGTWAVGDRLRIQWEWDNATLHGPDREIIQDIGLTGSRVIMPIQSREQIVGKGLVTQRIKP